MTECLSACEYSRFFSDFNFSASKYFFTSLPVIKIPAPDFFCSSNPAEIKISSTFGICLEIVFELTFKIFAMSEVVLKFFSCSNNFKISCVRCSKIFHLKKIFLTVISDKKFKNPANYFAIKIK